MALDKASRNPLGRTVRQELRKIDFEIQELLRGVQQRLDREEEEESRAEAKKAAARAKKEAQEKERQKNEPVALRGWRQKSDEED